MRWYQHSYHTPLALRSVFLTIPRIPKFIHPAIATVTAMIFFFLLGSERRAVFNNLQHISGNKQLRLWWTVYRVFYSFCDLMVSYCYVPQANDAQLLSMLSHPDRGAEKIDSCLRLGKGLIVWTAHLGNWEFASRLLELHGVKVNVARVVEKEKPAEVTLRDLMSNERLQIVELNHDRLASVRLLHALRENEIVAIQGDRLYHAHWAPAQFLGVEMRFPLGPFILAYINGSPILPGFVVREKWLRYRVIMGEPIMVAHTDDRDRDLQAALQQAVAFLEKNLRAYNHQWLNFFDVWATQISPGASPGSRT
jgi:predicted LPLAT superfamily acyltransferase